jgi:hypothetical protein
MNPHHPVRLIAAFLLFMFAAQVAAEKPQSAISPDQLNQNSEQANSPGTNLVHTQVSRDPVTGIIAITPGSGTRKWALSPREKNMLSRSDEGLQATILANGAVTVNLRGRFQSMATATSEPGDDPLQMSCSIVDVLSLPENQTKAAH